MTIRLHAILVSSLALAGCGDSSSKDEAVVSNDAEVGASVASVQEVAQEERTAATPKAAKQPASPGPLAKPGACDVQDGRQLPALRLRAIGTEPFWGARIEGRCVTYSHPDDQPGTRVWTRFSGNAADGSWTGALGGKPFVLRLRTRPGCSDGMSDNRYPIAVALAVGGEERQGCAEPL